MLKGVTREEVKHGRVRGAIFKPPGPGPFKGDFILFLELDLICCQMCFCILLQILGPLYLFSIAIALNHALTHCT